MSNSRALRIFKAHDSHFANTTKPLALRTFMILILVKLEFFKSIDIATYVPRNSQFGKRLEGSPSRIRLEIEFDHLLEYMDKR